MRLIDYDPDLLTLPPNWKNRAIALKSKIAAESDDKARSLLINSNQALWKEVKNELAKLSNYKCWYTDSPQAGTDVDVDHFRPKNRIAELKNNVPPHTGYWWLAFELKNYRYSCIVANRRRTDIETNNTGGKSDYFPILDEKNRAWIPTQNCDEEQPLLLDPCKLSDVRLLTFKDDGEAMPRESHIDKPNAYHRADISIEYYHLNHSDFVRARQTLRDEINKLVHSAKRFYNKLETGDSDHEHAYETVLLKLRSLCDKKSPYSSFSISYIENFKHEDFLQGAFD